MLSCQDTKDKQSKPTVQINIFNINPGHESAEGEKPASGEVTSCDEELKEIGKKSATISQQLSSALSAIAPRLITMSNSSSITTDESNHIIQSAAQISKRVGELMENVSKVHGLDKPARVNKLGPIMEEMEKLGQQVVNMLDRFDNQAIDVPYDTDSEF